MTLYVLVEFIIPINEGDVFYMIVDFLGSPFEVLVNNMHVLQVSYSDYLPFLKALNSLHFYGVIYRRFIEVCEVYVPLLLNK